MCHGAIDPKYLMREAQARVAPFAQAPAEVATSRRKAPGWLAAAWARLALPFRLAASSRGAGRT
jgi:hypothetical protein